ncbi:MAG: hypothetical protein ACYCZW_00560 [Minisyncoccota bacterium]
MLIDLLLQNAEVQKYGWTKHSLTSILREGLVIGDTLLNSQEPMTVAQLSESLGLSEDCIRYNVKRLITFAPECVLVTETGQETYTAEASVVKS